MTPSEMERILKTIVCVVDTREQPTKAFSERMKGIGFPFVRRKLDVGDYSAEYTVGGNTISVENEITIERKMSIDEICNNFTRGRGRFEREFERASKNGCKVHLIIEQGNYEKIIKGSYRSKMSSNSLLSSITAFCDRYNITIHFCRPETTPILMHKLFYHHIRNKIMKDVEV